MYQQETNRGKKTYGEFPAAVPKPPNMDSVCGTVGMF